MRTRAATSVAARTRARISALPLDHLDDQAPRPHRAGVEVEVVEDLVRVLLDRLLLGGEDVLVLAEDARDALADLGRPALLVEMVVAAERPEVVAGGVGLRRHRVDHPAVDALGAVALRRAGAGRRHADVDRD